MTPIHNVRIRECPVCRINDSQANSTSFLLKYYCNQARKALFQENKKKKTPVTPIHNVRIRECPVCWINDSQAKQHLAFVEILLQPSEKSAYSREKLYKLILVYIQCENRNSNDSNAQVRIRETLVTPIYNVRNRECPVCRINDSHANSTSFLLKYYCTKREKRLFKREAIKADTCIYAVREQKLQCLQYTMRESENVQCVGYYCYQERKSLI